MSKCPRCFNYLPLDAFAFEATEGAQTVDETSSEYRGHSVTTGEVRHYPASGAPPAMDQVESELNGSVNEVCPICHYRLPPGWRGGNATCFAMAGARGTGKTVYIAVMVQQLQRLLEREGRELVPANGQTNENYKKVYLEEFEKERGMLPSTSGAEAGGSYQHDPLVFSMGVWNGIREYLVVRDVAGEDLQKGVDGQEWSFFAAADAVLFLFDPMAVEQIRDQLRDMVVLGTEDANLPREALRTVMRLVRSSPPTLRLGVVLSKFDALQALSNVEGTWGQVMSNRGAAFARDPGLLGRQYDEEDGIRLHCEVQSLLQKLDAGPALCSLKDLETERRHFGRFFAVSALGDSPQNKTFDPQGFAAFRCLDPIRWVLAQRQIL